MGVFSQNLHVWHCEIFSCIVVLQWTNFSGAVHSCFWWNIIPVNYQNAYFPKAFEGGDMLRGDLTFTHSYINMLGTSIEGSCGVMWLIKCIFPTAKHVTTPN